MLDIEAIKSACTDDTMIITEHALERMKERNIIVDDISACIMQGEIIEQYPTDKPYLSCLIFRNGTKSPLHVVLSLNNGIIWIITAYVPTLDKWEDDYKTRKAVK